MLNALPARQVHLDFHTSEHCPGVGSKFDKKQFQDALRLGRVNFITVFAKCHHSWCYYPTKVGRMHPGLGFDREPESQDHQTHHEMEILPTSGPGYYKTPMACK